MVLIIDNYDSFVYNLRDLFLQVYGAEVLVKRNDVLDIADISALKPSLIVLSPGPKAPKDAGICLDIVRYFAGKIPIFGVCLGHQVICEAFGGTVEPSGTPFHGRNSLVYHDSSGIFKGLVNPISVGRYHSLIATKPPIDFEVSARTEDGTIMGLRSARLRIESVQFHPESILTTQGKYLIKLLVNTHHPSKNGVDKLRYQ
jgi:anthranilate synthase/aminodeoxychorismate synthase-like glutamine amidotransferase